MIWTTDAAGQTTYMCQEWYAFTGQRPPAALADGWVQAIHPDERAMMGDAFLKACHLQCEFVLQYRLRRHDGTYVWVVDSAAPSRLPDAGTFLGFLGMIRRLDRPPKGLVARAELETFRAKTATGEFAPVSKLDVVANHLLMARAAAIGAADEMLPAIDSLLFDVGSRLARGLQQGDASANIH
ncbi:PAS domain-containing protein [Methylobacterium sp. E-046]|uniref:PAS domain-containing protein n=1 Tax=Methylobacterium sp. E-046 TaxID=2836576 RepID=UPI001FB9F8A7|nr:PAS domain-containing protein [Methylobacterium sp. E-046]MCJ2103010.1 PAS domain-containing protein [Methylobacterium sp. E-046]